MGFQITRRGQEDRFLSKDVWWAFQWDRQHRIPISKIFARVKNVDAWSFLKKGRPVRECTLLANYARPFVEPGIIWKMFSCRNRTLELLSWRRMEISSPPKVLFCVWHLNGCENIKLRTQSQEIRNRQIRSKCGHLSKLVRSNSTMVVLLWLLASFFFQEAVAASKKFLIRRLKRVKTSVRPWTLFYRQRTRFYREQNVISIFAYVELTYNRSYLMLSTLF